MKRIVLMFIIMLICIVTGCSYMDSIDDVIVPQNCVYDVNIASVDADDIYMNLIIGRGIDVGGVPSAYVFKVGERSYLRDNRGTILLDDTSLIDEKEFVGDYIVSLMYSIIENYSNQSVERSIEIINGDKKYKFKFYVEDEDYGRAEISVLTDTADLILESVNLRFEDDLSVTMSIYDIDDVIDNTDNFIYTIVSYKAQEVLVDNFIKNNVYTYGKYQIVNSIVDAYSEWLGGDI